MEFSILGPTELTVEGRSIPLGAAKQRGLLAILLYHAGDPVRIETIVEFLWQGSGVDARRPLSYTLASGCGRSCGPSAYRTPWCGCPVPGLSADCRSGVG